MFLAPSELGRVPKTKTNKLAPKQISTTVSLRLECHLCQVAGNTVWSHMAREFQYRCGDFDQRTAISLLLYFSYFNHCWYLSESRVLKINKVWLTPTTRVPCSNTARTPNPLKLPGVPQTNETISAAIGPKFTILWGHVGEILLLNKFFSSCRYVP